MALESTSYSRFSGHSGAGQRTAERRELDRTVHIREAGTGDSPLPLPLSQVSASGAFVESNLLLPIGAQLEVTFDLPGYAHAVSADARVVRVEDGGKHPGMGIVFDRMPPRARAHLRDIGAWA